MSAVQPLAVRGIDAEIDALAPWFHNLHLPDGTQTAPGHPFGDFPAFKWREIAPHVPRDLYGWRVLDVGCNAGFYCFEMKRRGASRVLGIDFSDYYLNQARFAAEVLGFDECLDHREGDLAGRLAAACPAGIDVYFESVGGEVLAAVLPLLNLNARIPLCGFIAHYNERAPANGPDHLPQLLGTLLSKRVLLQGFIILDHYATRYADFQRDMGAWIEAGDIVVTEDVVEGLEQAPQALIGLLQGRNFGKLVVKVD